MTRLGAVPSILEQLDPGRWYQVVFLWCTCSRSLVSAAGISVGWLLAPGILERKAGRSFLDKSPRYMYVYLACKFGSRPRRKITISATAWGVHPDMSRHLGLPALLCYHNSLWYCGLPTDSPILLLLLLSWLTLSLRCTNPVPSHSSRTGTSLFQSRHCAHVPEASKVSSLPGLSLWSPGVPHHSKIWGTNTTMPSWPWTLSLSGCGDVDSGPHVLP